MHSTVIGFLVLGVTLLILGVVSLTLFYVVRLFKRGDSVYVSQTELIRQIADRHESMIGLLSTLTDEILRLRQDEKK